MAQFNKNTQDFLNQERTLFEVNMIANKNGNVVTTDNRFPVDAIVGGTSASAFGEPYATTINPVIQFDAAYGQEPLEDQNIIDLVQEGAGIVTSVNSTLTLQSGITTGTAAIYSVRHLPYKPGQGSLGRFTASFTEGVTGTNQRAGLSNGENSYMVGYAGTTFGFIHSYNGEVEIRKLTLTTPASGSETATITLAGIATTVALTSGTTSFNAAQIARSTAFQPDGRTWRLDQIDNVLTFTSRSARPYTGTFSFSSATAVGTFSTTNTGVLPTQDVIPRSEWDNGPTNFDPTDFNVYQIQMRWLGAGAVTLSIEDPDTGKFTTSHTKKWISTGNQFPHISKPNLKLGFASATTVGIASSMVVKMSSAMAAIEGQILQSTYSLSAVNTDTTNRAFGNLWHTLSIRNPWEKYGKANTQELVVQNCSFAYQGNDPLLVYIFLNARANSPLQFSNINNAKILQSLTLGVTIDTATYTPSVVFNVPINGAGSIDLRPYRLILPPGQEINIGFLSNGQVSRSTTGLTFNING